MSALKTLAQYKGDKGLPPFSKLYRDFEDLVSKKLNVDDLQSEY